MARLTLTEATAEICAAAAEASRRYDEAIAHVRELEGIIYRGTHSDDPLTKAALRQATHTLEGVQAIADARYAELADAIEARTVEAARVCAAIDAEVDPQLAALRRKMRAQATELRTTVLEYEFLRSDKETRKAGRQSPGDYDLPLTSERLAWAGAEP